MTPDPQTPWPIQALVLAVEAAGDPNDERYEGRILVGLRHFGIELVDTRRASTGADAPPPLDVLIEGLRVALIEVPPIRWGATVGYDDEQIITLATSLQAAIAAAEVGRDTSEGGA